MPASVVRVRKSKKRCCGRFIREKLRDERLKTELVRDGEKMARLLAVRAEIPASSRALFETRLNWPMLKAVG